MTTPARREARRVLEIEAAAIRSLADSLDGGFDTAVALLHGTTGRVVVTGIGKSGIVGQKIAATLASTGTPAFFLHPAEAIHGDLGMITAEDVVLDTRYGGPEYGLPNEGTLEAIRLCARQEGMLTDPVYEGKSMHGMIDRVRRGEFPEGSRVLYAHLGGVPALNAYSFLFRNG